MTRWLFFLLLFSLSHHVSATENIPSVTTAVSLDPLNTTLSPEFISQRQESLTELEANLARKNAKLQIDQQELPNKIAQLDVNKVTQKILDSAILERDTAQVEVKNAEVEVQNAENAQREHINLIIKLQNDLNVLRKMPSPAEQVAAQTQQITDLEKNIALQKATRELDDRQLHINKQRFDLAVRRLAHAEQWVTAIQKLYQTRQKQSLAEQNQQEWQHYLEETADLRAQLEKTQLPIQRYLLEIKLQLAEEHQQKRERQLKLQNIQNQLTEFESASIAPHAAKVSQEMIRQADVVVHEIQDSSNILDSKLQILQQQLQATKKNNEVLLGTELKIGNEIEKSLDNTIKELTPQQALIRELSKTATQHLSNLTAIYQTRLREMLLRQRILPKNWTEWQDIFNEVSSLPALFVQQVSISTQGFVQTFQRMSAGSVLMLGLGSGLWLAVFLWFYSLLGDLLKQLDRPNAVRVHSEVWLRLLRMNLIGLAITGIILLVSWIAQPRHSSLLLTHTLVFLWLGVKFPLNLSHLILSGRYLSDIRQRSKIYHQLRWSVIATGTFTAITSIVHLLPISLTLRDLFDSVFMLLLSLTTFPVLFIRRISLAMLENSLKGYWLSVVGLSSLLLPMSIFAVAVLGLVGYINLGWTVAKLLSLFLCVFTLWLILRGLLSDLISLLKNFALKHSKYGLLWTQDIIPLLHKLLDTALILLGIACFFWINGWFSDVAVMENVKSFWHYPLLKMLRVQVTIGNLLLLGFSLWLIFWLGRWARQITYRWIYSSINDLGVRNSLSVFTQYAVILIGLLVTLRLVGVDLTTLTVFAGALGVGIGFGLQNIANNFISGILLLIERPLRTGDVVNISQFEGTVTHIGIRSLTLTTSENQEVIMPNSELLSRAFVNLTHSDSSVRTTLYITTSYDDDPHKVVQILRDILYENADVLKEPPSQALLWDFGDFSVKYRIDFFVNLQKVSRSQVRSHLFMTIWDRFKAACITMPYPRREIYMKSGNMEQPASEEVSMLNAESKAAV